MKTVSIIENLIPGRRLSRDEAMALVAIDDMRPLLQAAVRRRDKAHGVLVTYSRKVFIPLTQLCRDVCHN
jgi:FO synthase